MRQLNAIVLLLVTAIGLGCSPTAPDVDRLHVAVTVTPSTVRPGEDVTVRVLAGNLTPTHLEFSSSSCVLTMRIFDDDGDEVYPIGYPCFDIRLVHTLAPGEYLEETFDFDGHGRRGEDHDYERYPLPPGSYWIEGTATNSFREPVRIGRAPGSSERSIIAKHHAQQIPSVTHRHRRALPEAGEEQRSSSRPARRRV